MTVTSMYIGIKTPTAVGHLGALLLHLKDILTARVCPQSCIQPFMGTGLMAKKLLINPTRVLLMIVMALKHAPFTGISTINLWKATWLSITFELQTKNQNHRLGIWFLVRPKGFSAGLRLACALRYASSRLRYPTAKSADTVAFLTQLQIPFE